MSQAAPIALCLALTLGAVPGAAFASSPRAAQTPPAPELPVAVPDLQDPAWITLGVPAFAIAESHFARTVQGPPPRLGEAAGVVLTVVPRAALAGLRDRLRAELGHRGGFALHRSRAEAEARLAKVAARALPRAPEVLPFVVDEPEWVANLQAGVDEARILATITALSTNTPNRRQSSPHGVTAAHWIRDLWTSFAAGRPGVTVELVAHADTSQPSVRLTIPGSTLASEYVILGGHEDSTASGCSANPNCAAPGADDNASGIATVTEVARVALAHGFSPQRTVQFIAYAAEEVGLWGSGEIADAYAAAGVNVVAVLNLDMTGYHGSTEDVFLISDYSHAELNGFVASLLDTYQPTLLRSTDDCGYGCSDHASWSLRGLPGVVPVRGELRRSEPVHPRLVRYGREPHQRRLARREVRPPRRGVPGRDEPRRPRRDLPRSLRVRRLHSLERHRRRALRPAPSPARRANPRAVHLRSRNERTIEGVRSGPPCLLGARQRGAHAQESSEATRTNSRPRSDPF